MRRVPWEIWAVLALIVLDGIAVRWLEHDCDLPVDNLVEAMVQFVVGSLQAACCLDAKLDVSEAIARLTSPPRRRS